MEKQTLVKLKTNMWHYKFMSWALGSLAPTSSNMFNLCPYFWLLIFSIIVLPFIIISKCVGFLFQTLDAYIDRKFLIPISEEWRRNLTKEDIYNMWYEKHYYSITFRNNKKHLKKLNKSSDEILMEFYENYTGEEVDNINIEKFRIWVRKIGDEIKNKQQSKVFKEKLSDKIINTISEKWTSFTKSISNWSIIVKWTKRFTGLVITILGLFLTYFIITFITKETIWLIMNWDWTIFGVTILILIGSVIIATIATLFFQWIEYMKQKGTELWYVKLLYYTIVFPIKSIFYFILNILKALWKGFISFLGIFGEYFGASYTDYCPGIEWEE